MAKEFLQGKNLDLNEVEKICEAIKNHGGKNSSDFDDKLSMCLLLADKMDFTYKRYFKADKSDAFLKNHKLIKRNKLEMNEREIKLTIVCDKKFDKDEYLNS